MPTHNPSPQRDLVLYGGWYLAEVFGELAEITGWNVLGCVDPAPADGVESLVRIPPDAACMAAIGDNRLRHWVNKQLLEHGRDLATLIHPSAVISPSATIGAGCYIGESAIVRTSAKVGDGAMVNAGGIVSHHASLGRNSTLGPNAAMASRTCVGEAVMVGVGACIRPCVNVGDWATVGAGSVVVRNVRDEVTVVGNPAIEIVASGSVTPQSDWFRNKVW